LEEYDEANREASDAQQSVQGLLRIAAPVTFGTMHLSDVIARYMDKHPNVTIDLLLNDRYVDLLSEGVDVAIRIGRLLDSDLVARRLAQLSDHFHETPKHGDIARIGHCRARTRQRLVESLFIDRLE